jgi:uncharacterized membrane protein YeaQ/YmgE (transglycosylase-associated protein family)
MWVFELISWVLFGLTIGGLVGFFMEKRQGPTVGYLFAGTAGAVVGGLLGELVGELWPKATLDASGYSLLSLLLAIGGSIVLVFIDRRTYRIGRPVFQDARPDLP